MSHIAMPDSVSIGTRTRPQRASQQLGADALLFLVAVVWGGTFVMVKDAVSAYPVFPFLTLRFAMATGRFSRHRRPAKTPPLRMAGVRANVLIGLCLFVGYALQTLGLQYTSASKAGFITGLCVVLVPILSALLLRRRPSPPALIGVGLATVGLALLTLTHDLHVAAGDLIVLGGAVSFALHIVAVSAYAPAMDPLALTIVQVATVGVLSAGISLLAPGPFPVPGPSVRFAAAFTGILATAVTRLPMRTAMQRFTTPTHTALIFAGEPCSRRSLASLGRRYMTAAAVTGGILIVVGTLVSESLVATATVISRFLSQCVVLPAARPRGLPGHPLVPGAVWVSAARAGLGGGAAAALRRELARGAISDWHISDRRERLQPVPVIASVWPPPAPRPAAHPRRPACWSSPFKRAAPRALNHLITIGWKISQHVSSIAASTTLLTATLGIGAAPLLLLVPLVAWARVKVGAHTVAQTVMGAVAGSAITLGVLRCAGVV